MFAKLQNATANLTANLPPLPAAPAVNLNFGNTLRNSVQAGRCVSPAAHAPPRSISPARCDLAADLARYPTTVRLAASASARLPPTS